MSTPSSLRYSPFLVSTRLLVSFVSAIIYNPIIILLFMAVKAFDLGPGAQPGVFNRSHGTPDMALVPWLAPNLGLFLFTRSVLRPECAARDI